MTNNIRKIIHIDEDKCDGCGNCIPSCAEGALAIVDGKAKVIKDMFCDGLGACLGHCPQDALTIIEREAEAFDEDAAMEHVRKTGHDALLQGDGVTVASGCPSGKVEVFEPKAQAEDSGGCPCSGPMPRAKGTEMKPQTLGCGCPGSAMRTFEPAPAAKDEETGSLASQLTHWPIKLRLVPPNAPFLQNADLLLAADCAPGAAGNFHQGMLKGRALTLACPKFEDREASVAKLADILGQARPRSLTVVRMEVPCCTGLSQIADEAIQRAGVDVIREDMVISRQGEPTRQL